MSFGAEGKKERHIPTKYASSLSSCKMGVEGDTLDLWCPLPIVSL